MSRKSLPRPVASDRSRAPPPAPARRERQRAYWAETYADDPTFFGAQESEFARWCLPWLKADPTLHEIVELGCGYGRDARFFSAQGYRVLGVDLVEPEASRGSPADRAPPPPHETMRGDALECLQRLPDRGVDVVYSNMFFNMDFTEKEHRELMAAVHRVLRPAGLHCFSVRAVSDPWYGRGRRLGPDRFEPVPGGIPLHFFSTSYLEKLIDRRFTSVHRVERTEGEGDFPIRLIYEVDRRRGRPGSRERPLIYRQPIERIARFPASRTLTEIG